MPSGGGFIGLLLTKPPFLGDILNEIKYANGNIGKKSPGNADEKSAEEQHEDHDNACGEDFFLKKHGVTRKDKAFRLQKKRGWQSLLFFSAANAADAGNDENGK